MRFNIGFRRQCAGRGFKKGLMVSNGDADRRIDEFEIRAVNFYRRLV